MGSLERCLDCGTTPQKVECGFRAKHVLDRSALPVRPRQSESLDLALRFRKLSQDVDNKDQVTGASEDHGIDQARERREDFLREVRLDKTERRHPNVPAITFQKGIRVRPAA